MIQQHIYTAARYQPTTHCDARPDGAAGEISLLVIHAISLPPGQFGARASGVGSSRSGSSGVDSSRSGSSGESSLLGPSSVNRASVGNANTGDSKTGHSHMGCSYIEDFFCGRLNTCEHEYFKLLEGVQVSAHLLIKRTGQCVQFVPFDKRAWHAGQSSYQGREKCNDFSIGIELEGDDHTPFEVAQYDALRQVTLALLNAYPLLTRRRIVGHSDIAPGRKTDPGPHFDWPRYLGAL